MNLGQDVQKSFSQIVKKLAKDAPDQKFDNSLEVNKKILSLFQVGDYYYYIFNLKTAQFDFISPEVEKVLGYKPEDLNTSIFISSIHPDDAPWFVNFENKVGEFFAALRPDQILKYKVRYDYRIRKANGDYIRILQQVVTVQYDENNGGILRTLGIHTDITHLKKDGEPLLSLIGLEDEPSYINVDVKKIFSPARPLITDREKEILRHLIEGMRSKEIAERLSISYETVNEHRKNMLRKTNATSTPELVAMAVKKGWV
ncbi:MAG: PAS domain-containing protein [Cyclobacteriaceae bacterium]|nr:PAS domain-containing protein [Cyclobacteriaceae bacterium]